MDTRVEQLHEWIDANRDRFVEAFRGVLRIPSTKAAPAGDGAPYGAEIRRALDYTLDLCRDLGFSVKDVDGHAAHAEFGDGEEMVAAFGHLDVVPAGQGWRHDPFGAEIDGGYVYSRGATDDKGGIYAALFGAAALLAAGLPVRRRVRVIFGCDEESGFGCVRHYWEVAGEERPVVGFTPDAAFPLFYAEKGMLGVTLSCELPPASGGIRVTDISSGTRSNIVPDAASARIEGDPADLYGSVVRLLSHWDRNVEVDADERGITVRARGRAAHAANPQAGDNALARLARTLLPVVGPPDRPWLAFLLQTTATDGSGLGIAGSDDVTGALTCNAGVTQTLEGRVEVRYSVRYPATWKSEDVIERAQPLVDGAGWRMWHSDSPPLHVPLDSEPVRSLLRVYREETGDDRPPATMGGATYARATRNAVAFGPILPGSSDGVAHQADERILIDNWVRAAKVYAHALYELANADLT